VRAVEEVGLAKTRVDHLLSGTARKNRNGVTVNSVGKGTGCKVGPPEHNAKTVKKSGSAGQNDEMWMLKVAIGGFG